MTRSKRHPELVSGSLPNKTVMKNIPKQVRNDDRIQNTGSY